MKRGPKSKFNLTVQRHICRSVRKCNSYKTAAQSAGISEQTLFCWLRTKPLFALAVYRARSVAKAKLVKVIVDAAPKDFRAACWLLERSYPGEYARTETRIIEQKAEEQKMGGCTILYNVGNHTLAELLDFPTMDDPPEVAAEKQRRLLEMTPAKNAPVSA